MAFAALVVLARWTEAQQGVVVEGRALDVRSEAIPRALVEVLRPESRYEAFSRFLAGEPLPPAVAQVRTDAEGAFRVEAPGNGPWTVVVSAPGRLPQLHEVNPLPRRQVLPAAILPEAAVEQVDLPGPSGLPAAGAWIEVEQRVQPESLQRYARFTGWRSEPIYGFADDEGRFNFVRGRDELLVLRARLPNATLRVRLGAGQPPGVDQAYARSAEAKPFQFRLADGRSCSAALVIVDGRLAGKTDLEGGILLDVTQRSQVEVLSPQGDRQAWSLSGFARSTGPAAVELQLSRPPQRRVQIVDLEGQAVPNAVAVIEGRAVSADAAGTLQALWRHRGRAEAWISAPGFVARRLDGREVESASWRLAPAVRVQGLVVDAEDRPVPGVDLRVSPLQAVEDDFERLWGRSDGLGRFQFEGLPSPGLFTVRATWRRQGAGRVIFGAQHPSDLRLVLLQERVVTGQVISEGRPLAGAQVQLQRQEVGAREVETDAQGTFTVRAAVGESWLRASYDGFAGLVQTVEIPRGSGRWDLGALEMPRGLSLELVVEKQDSGEPLLGAHVELVARRALRAPDGRETLATSRSHELEAFTDADGVARFGGLPAEASFDLLVELEGFQQWRIAGLEMPDDGVFEISLTPARLLTGRVVDVDSEPIRGAFVGITSLDGRTTPDLEAPYTDSEGRFSIDGLAEGHYRVWARASGHAAFESVEVALGEDEVEELLLREAPSAVLTGRVLSDEGRPLGEVRVVVAEQLATTDSTGDFVLEGVAVGRQEAELRAPDGRRERHVIDVDPGGSYVELSLGQISISGRVVDDGGEPVVGAEVTIQGPAANGQVAVTDESGAFRLDGVARGQGRLVAELGALRGATEGMNLRYSRTDVEIRVDGGSRIAGRISGLTNGGANVGVLLRRRGTTQFAPVNEDGEFLLEGVSPGTWELRVQETPRASMSTRILALRTVEVPVGGGEQYLDLVASAGRSAGAGSPLEGRLLVDETPGAAVHLTLVGASGESHWARTDLDGRFFFDDVPDGEYVLYSGEPGGGLAPVAAVRTPTTFVEARLHRARLDVEVLDASTGEPLEGTVELLSDAPPRRLDLMAGMLRREVFVRGAARLRVVAPGYEAVEVPLHGADQRLVLRRTGSDG
ncbi:MAG: carboxypeptidase regulatory-like domain-containing protein [Acidobacteriota bacterium]